MKEASVKLALVAGCGVRWPSAKTAPQLQLVLGTYEKVRRYRKKIRTEKASEPAFKWVLRDQWSQDTDAP